MSKRHTRRSKNSFGFRFPDQLHLNVAGPIIESPARGDIKVGAGYSRTVGMGVNAAVGFVGVTDGPDGVWTGLVIGTGVAEAVRRVAVGLRVGVAVAA